MIFFFNLEHPECPLEKAKQADYWLSLVKEHGQRTAICVPAKAPSLLLRSPGSIQTLKDTEGARCEEEGAYSQEAYAAGSHRSQLEEEYPGH